MEPQQQFPRKVCDPAVLIGLVLLLAALATGQDKPQQQRVYRDSDFGFTFSYPSAIKEYETRPVDPAGWDHGRCSKMQTGNLVIVACGEQLSSCAFALDGVIIGTGEITPKVGKAIHDDVPSNLRSAFWQWQDEVRRMHGSVENTRAESNWFLSRGSVAPSVVWGNPYIEGRQVKGPIVLIRKAFVGFCLDNYITIYVPPEGEQLAQPVIQQTLESFQPGDMDAMPSKERRKAWRSPSRTVPLP